MQLIFRPPKKILKGAAMKTLKTWAATAATVALTSTAQATPLPLVDVGDGTVWDPNKHLIWLKDWSVNGASTWGAQNDWAEGLVFAGSGDWHLPQIQQYADLYGDYGNLSSNTLPFTNVQPDSYWSGTQFSPGIAWHFYPGDGSQSAGGWVFPFFAVAVRTGDVAASVPEPQTLALALLALGATVVARRRRPA
jgi:MYXO-CTERM domain-containing protein